MTTESRSRLSRVLPWMLVIGGIIGILCSLILTYDQIRIWENPNYTPACNLNPIVSCGNVINSKQGDVFGIPGPFFGLLAFPVLVTIGVAIVAGAKFKRWFWAGLEIGAIGGLASALLLFFISLYRVHALCPFCLTVDAVVYTLFWYITLYNIETEVITVPKGWGERAAVWMRKHHLDLLVLWFLIIIVYTLKHFWYYYGHYF